ncbi:MAG: hypothetical protein ACI8S6_005626 [Myxococcota bacterium]|jgi:hypothetical protein
MPRQGATTKPTSSPRTCELAGAHRCGTDARECQKQTGRGEFSRGVGQQGQQGEDIGAGVRHLPLATRAESGPEIPICCSARSGSSRITPAKTASAHAHSPPASVHAARAGATSAAAVRASIMSSLSQIACSITAIRAAFWMVERPRAIATIASSLRMRSMASWMRALTDGARLSHPCRTAYQAAPENSSCIHSWKPPRTTSPSFRMP